MEPSNGKGLFLCYNETSKAYRVYILEKRKAILCNDVRFDEDFASPKSHVPILVRKDEQETSKVESRPHSSEFQFRTMTL